MLLRLSNPLYSYIIYFLSNTTPPPAWISRFKGWYLLSEVNKIAFIPLNAGYCSEQILERQ